MNCEFVNNTMNSAGGGAIYFIYNSEVSIVDSIFEKNLYDDTAIVSGLKGINKTIKNYLF